MKYGLSPADNIKRENNGIKDLKNDEKAVFSLRSLYKSYGYMRYKMKKFEDENLIIYKPVPAPIDKIKNIP